MRLGSKLPCVLLAPLLLAVGCATTTHDGIATWQSAQAPAWALNDPQDQMTVAVSPTRQTLQMVGLTGAAVGAGISAIADARHRRAVEQVLEDFDAGAMFDARLSEGLAQATGGHLARVGPQGSWAGFKNQREASEARLAGLAGEGYDLLMDLQVAYGLFGHEGTLIAKIEGEMRDLPGGRLLWRNTLLVSSEEVLASDRLTDPTNRMRANYRSPRLAVQEGAIEQWTGDGGVLLRARMEEAIDGAVSALLTDLGLKPDARGHYQLGRLAMNRKEFDSAQTHFQQALTLAPGDRSTVNAMSVNLAHNGQVREAVELAEQLAAREPDFGPAHYNLAWWYAVELGAAEQARAHYERALALGMPEERRINRALNRE